MAPMSLRSALRVALLGVTLGAVLALAATAAAFSTLAGTGDAAATPAFWLATAAGMALAFGGSLALIIVARGLPDRMLKLRDVIAEIGRGNLDVEIPMPAGGEMGEVMREVHHMRLGLLQSMGELARLNLERVAAQAQLEDRVAERTASLQAANRELEAFGDAVSHDLRAPLRAMAGFSQAVLDDQGARLDDEGRAMLRRIHRAAGHMTDLVEDLLKLSRAGRQPEIAETDLSALVVRIGKTLADAAPERAVRLRTAVGIHADCDAGLIGIVLSNLIDNAWKFTAQTRRPEIVFGQRVEAGRQTFFVRDNGIGFDMAEADKLFLPFQRLHPADAFPGSGIGLATVSRIIRLHGGRIWAESAPGKGATFFFQLGEPPEAERTAAPKRHSGRAGGARQDMEYGVVRLRTAQKE